MLYVDIVTIRGLLLNGKDVIWKYGWFVANRNIFHKVYEQISMELFYVDYFNNIILSLQH